MQGRNDYLLSNLSRPSKGPDLSFRTMSQTDSVGQCSARYFFPNENGLLVDAEQVERNYNDFWFGDFYQEDIHHSDDVDEYIECAFGIQVNIVFFRKQFIGLVTRVSSLISLKR